MAMVLLCAVSSYSQQATSTSSILPQQFHQSKSEYQDALFEGHYYLACQLQEASSLGVQLNQLKKGGIKILQWKNNSHYLFAIPKSLSGKHLKALGIRSIRKVSLTEKLSADLISETYPDWALMGNDGVEVVISFHESVNKKSIESFLAIPSG